MEDPNIADSDSIADQVQIDLHLFGPLVLHRVGGEIHRTDVVAVDQCASGEGCGARQGAVEAKRPQPCLCDSAVLRLGTGAGDHRLALGRPGPSAGA